MNILSAPPVDRIVFHSLASRYATLALDLDIQKSRGFDGIELSGSKIQDYLDAGFSEDDLKILVGDAYVPGIGYLQDIERQGEARQKLFAEADQLFKLASIVGAKGVQVITGPINMEAVAAHRAGRPSLLYQGLLDFSPEQQLELTARNLAELADRAEDYGLTLYLEGLSWTPINTLEKQVSVLEMTGRHNVKLVIDFWHCYTSGDTPRDIAKLDKTQIYGVHLCDSLKYEGGIPDEPKLRNVLTGQGVLNLQEWVDAVKSTGYNAWWSCELFCVKSHQTNSYDVAEYLENLLRNLIGTGIKK